MLNMRILLSLSLLIVVFLTGCTTGGYYQQSYGYNYGYDSNYYQQQAHYRSLNVVGPQYYRVRNAPCGVPIRNYTDAPLVVTRSHGSREIIPRSWD